MLYRLRAGKEGKKLYALDIRPNNIFSILPFSPLSERWTILSSHRSVSWFLRFFFFCRIFLHLVLWSIAVRGEGVFRFPSGQSLLSLFFFDFLGSGFGVNTFPRRERHFQTWRPFPKPFIFYPCKCGTSDTLVFLLSSRCTVARQRIEVHQSSHSRGVNVAPVRIMKLFVATMTPPLSQIFYVSLFEHGFS